VSFTSFRHPPRRVFFLFTPVLLYLPSHAILGFRSPSPLSWSSNGGTRLSLLRRTCKLARFYLCYDAFLLRLGAFPSSIPLSPSDQPFSHSIHRSLPIGISGGASIVIGGAIPPKLFPLRWRLVSGSILSAGGALMLAFAHTKHDYWRLMFPAFIIGSSGTGLGERDSIRRFRHASRLSLNTSQLSFSSVFVSANVSLMLSVPPETAGVAGGVFNSSLRSFFSPSISVSSPH
jgi:hypothetical protein